MKKNKPADILNLFFEEAESAQLSEKELDSQLRDLGSDPVRLVGKGLGVVSKHLNEKVKTLKQSSVSFTSEQFPIAATKPAEKLTKEDLRRAKNSKKC